MYGAFYRLFTTYCGVNKNQVIHMTYPQVVYIHGEKVRFAVKNCCFPCFLKKKHLFSVDNPVHTVYKSVKSSKP